MPRRPEAPSIGSARDLTTAVGNTTRKLIYPRAFRSAPVHVLRWGPCAVRGFQAHALAPAWSKRALARAPERDLRLTLPRAHPTAFRRSCSRAGKMLLTDFCNRPTTRVPGESFDSRGEHRFRVSRAPWADAPEATRVTARLTAHHELRPAPHHALADPVRCGRLLILVSPRSCGALSEAPLGSRRCLPRTRSACDLWRSCRDGQRAEAPARRRDRFPRRLVKGNRFPRSGASSIDECPLGPALSRLTSNADPPPITGLCRPAPASDALSPARAPRRRLERGLDHAASARSSRAGARGHAPLVDFCNR
jgi:hypothetical protein